MDCPLHDWMTSSSSWQHPPRRSQNEMCTVESVQNNVESLTQDLPQSASLGHFPKMLHFPSRRKLYGTDPPASADRQSASRVRTGLCLNQWDDLAKVVDKFVREPTFSPNSCCGTNLTASRVSSPPRVFDDGSHEDATLSTVNDRVSPHMSSLNNPYSMISA